MKLLLSRRGFVVGLIISGGYYKSICDELMPYIDINNVEEIGDNIIKIYSINSFSGDVDGYMEYIEKRENEPDNVILYRVKTREIIIVQNDDRWELKYCVRLIRNLIRWQMYTSNYVFLHGGMVNIDNVGVAFLGKKRSGKTSSIITALTRCNSEYISNDDLCVFDDDNNTALGWPRAISIRKDTLQYLDKLKHLYTDEKYLRCHPINSYHKVNLTMDKIYLTPKKMCEYINIKMKTEGSIKVIIFPKFHKDECSVRKIDNGEALEALMANVESLPDKHSDFLIDFFQIPSKEAIKRKVLNIIERARCYEVKQNMQTLNEATIKIQMIVKNVIERTL